MENTLVNQLFENKFIDDTNNEDNLIKKMVLDIVYQDMKFGFELTKHSPALSEDDYLKLTNRVKDILK